MSGYDWEREHYDAAERAREWDRADNDRLAEETERDRVTRDVGERAAVRPTMHEGKA